MIRLPIIVLAVFGLAWLACGAAIATAIENAKFRQLEALLSVMPPSQSESVLPPENWKPCAVVADAATMGFVFGEKLVTVVVETCDNGDSHLYAGKKYEHSIAQETAGIPSPNGVEVMLPRAEVRDE